MKCWLTGIGLLVLAVAGVASLAQARSSTAGAAGLQDMPVSSLLFSHSARLTRLGAGTTYQATKFPLQVRLRPPTRGWAGAQWKTGRLYPALAESHGIADGGGPPHFGWLAVAHAGAHLTDPPLGMVTVMTAFARTPSVAATVNMLRTRGHGATYGPSSAVTVAGFAGTQFDGEIVGARPDHIGHLFVPFSPPTHAAHYFSDEYPVYGEVFRIIVLNVHRKAVVVFIENVALPADRFPTFLVQSNQILESLRFPT